MLEIESYWGELEAVHHLIARKRDGPTLRRGMVDGMNQGGGTRILLNAIA
jgi:hypothetical protein